MTSTVNTESAVEQAACSPPPYTGLAYYLWLEQHVAHDVLSQALEAAERLEQPLAIYLIKHRLIDSQTLLACCQKHHPLPIADLTQVDFELLHQAVIDHHLIQRYYVLPLQCIKQDLHLAIADSTDSLAIEAIRFQSRLTIQPYLAHANQLEEILTNYFHNKSLHAQLTLTLSQLAVQPATDTAITAPQQDEPVINFVDQLLQDAIAKKISDIHLEPYQTHCRIRFRQDGLLYEAITLPAHLAIRVITRLKIMANLNISERRLPQDGRIKLPQVASIDMRISTCPTLFGEKIVVRLLNHHPISLNIDALGLNTQQKQLFLDKLAEPQGLILATGPTGSGKTITLYTALSHLNHPEKNISTVEDPIEIQLPGINQVSIHPKIGLNFETVLRALLRQDPDILMVGEIRDVETAKIALQAAQTGHLVLSTLHTNSAIGTITRLHNLGFATHYLINAISLIIAQRLPRKCCTVCQGNHRWMTTCQHCHHGYQGRTGIFELLAMNEQLAQLILTNTPPAQIIAQLKQQGEIFLWEAGLEKISANIIDYPELKRVLNTPSL